MQRDIQLVYGACFWAGVLLLIAGLFTSTPLAVGGGLIAAMCGLCFVLIKAMGEL